MLTRRTVTPVTDRHTVTRTETRKVVTLHDTLETFSDPARGKTRISVVSFSRPRLLPSVSKRFRPWRDEGKRTKELVRRRADREQSELPKSKFLRKDGRVSRWVRVEQEGETGTNLQVRVHLR